MAETSEARQFLASFHSTGVVSAKDLEGATRGAPPGKEFLTLPQVLSKMETPTLDVLKVHHSTQHCSAQHTKCRAFRKRLHSL